MVSIDKKKKNQQQQQQQAPLIADAYNVYVQLLLKSQTAFQEKT